VNRCRYIGYRNYIGRIACNVIGLEWEGIKLFIPIRYCAAMVRGPRRLREPAPPTSILAGTAILATRSFRLTRSERRQIRKLVHERPSWRTGPSRRYAMLQELHYDATASHLCLRGLSYISLRVGGVTETKPGTPVTRFLEPCGRAFPTIMRTHAQTGAQVCWNFRHSVRLCELMFVSVERARETSPIGIYISRHLSTRSVDPIPPYPHS
jgi:hypothetical protein